MSILFLKNYGKCKEDCQYKHRDIDKNDELSKLRLENENKKHRNQKLESDMNLFESVNYYLKDSLRTIQEEIETCKQEKEAIERENKDPHKINENLLEEILFINVNIGYIVPGKLGDEILELKNLMQINLYHFHDDYHETYRNTKNSRLKAYHA